MPELHLFPIALAVVASAVIGMLWYGPLFGKKWLVLTGTTQDDTQKGWIAPMVFSLFAAFIGAMIFDIFTMKMGVDSMRGFVETAIWLWLGFFALPTLVNTLFRGTSRSLWAIEAFHVCAWMVAMAVIFSKTLL